VSQTNAAALRDADRLAESQAADAADSLVRLSPSRASDYKTCPQLFKYRAIDRLPEPADIYSTRGTLIHAVLEQLYLLDPIERTIERARALMVEVWANLKADAEYSTLELDPEEEASWLEQADGLLVNFFRVEDPTTVSPHELEWWVEHQTELTLLRGIIDRVEIMPDGEWVLSDYKTGRSPSETYALGSFFGLKFYALVCWRTFGKMPKLLRLMHLKEPEIITLVPTPQMLKGLEKQLDALGQAILRARERDDWRPRTSHMCNYCPHKPICPAYEAERAAAAVVSERPSGPILVPLGGPIALAPQPAV
jgi:putative RecB family exonuclease